MLDQNGFDLWADGYDQTVGISDEENTYPFAGYRDVLGGIFQIVMEKPNAAVLEIGFGTGTLAAKLYAHGCSIYGQDFSAKMIELASGKMPGSHLYQGDFTKGLRACSRSLRPRPFLHPTAPAGSENLEILQNSERLCRFRILASPLRGHKVPGFYRAAVKCRPRWGLQPAARFRRRRNGRPVAGQGHPQFSSPPVPRRVRKFRRRRDLEQALAEPLQHQRYDFIVATYSLHHLTDAQKIPFLHTLCACLKENGKILIGDIAFETRAQMDQCRRNAGEDWDEEESYFVAGELRRAFPGLAFRPVSYCAGILTLTRPLPAGGAAGFGSNR